MKPDKQLHEAWENAVALSDAWLVFAYAKNKKRFHELHLDDNHLGLRSHMEQELIWRIADGEFQAFGVEHGGDTGPIHIPKYYFSKNLEVDWDQETVEAFGKNFMWSESKENVNGNRQPKRSRAKNRSSSTCVRSRLDGRENDYASHPRARRTRPASHMKSRIKTMETLQTHLCRASRRRR
jgi:hypothetical protein